MVIVKTVILLLILFAAWYYVFKAKKNKPKNERIPLDKLNEVLSEKVLYYSHLEQKEKVRFQISIHQFLDKVAVHGVETEVDDVDKILVASSAVIPLFGFPNWSFRKLDEVLLYENQFGSDFQTTGANRSILGMVGSGALNRAMILSKPALRQGFENQHSKNNVGIHEFIHLIDKADGVIDGIPDILLENQMVLPWLDLIHKEIKEIISAKSDINPYGATNESEFLSVVGEYFFSQPSLFEKKHPELFKMMEEMFRQDL